MYIYIYIYVCNISLSLYIYIYTHTYIHIYPASDAMFLCLSGVARGGSAPMVKNPHHHGGGPRARVPISSASRRGRDQLFLFSSEVPRIPYMSPMFVSVLMRTVCHKYHACCHMSPCKFIMGDWGTSVKSEHFGGVRKTLKP